jgi:hypothetical protein
LDAAGSALGYFVLSIAGKQLGKFKAFQKVVNGKKKM